jgi:hypothetical protein
VATGRHHAGDLGHVLRPARQPGAARLARWFKEHATEEQRAFLAPESSPWDAPLDAQTIPPPTW